MSYLISIKDPSDKSAACTYIGPFESIEKAERYLNTHDFTFIGMRKNQSVRIRIYYMNEPVDLGVENV